MELSVEYVKSGSYLGKFAGPEEEGFPSHSFGDYYMNTSNAQLYMYNGIRWVLDKSQSHLMSGFSDAVSIAEEIPEDANNYAQVFNNLTAAIIQVGKMFANKIKLMGDGDVRDINPITRAYYDYGTFFDITESSLSYELSLKDGCYIRGNFKYDGKTYTFTDESHLRIEISRGTSSYPAGGFWLKGTRMIEEEKPTPHIIELDYMREADRWFNTWFEGRVYKGSLGSVYGGSKYDEDGFETYSDSRGFWIGSNGQLKAEQAELTFAIVQDAVITNATITEDAKFEGSIDNGVISAPTGSAEGTTYTYPKGKKFPVYAVNNSTILKLENIIGTYGGVK